MTKRHFQASFLWLIIITSLFSCHQAEKTLSTGENVNDYINKMIDENTLMIFAKSTCPYCRNSHNILDRLIKENGMQGWTSRVMHLDDYLPADALLLHGALIEQTGHRTVPNIFLAGQHIGGNSDLANIFQSGELLRKILEIAGTNLQTCQATDEEACSSSSRSSSERRFFSKV